MTDVYDMSLEGRNTARSGRRSRRISSDLWLRVGGVEAALCRRRGDLCATGIYIATTEAVGCPGDVLMLSLASGDKARSAKTLARVARVIRQDDRARGARVIGAAFEFLPLDKLQEDVVALLHHVAACELGNYGLLRFDDAITAVAESSEGTLHCELRSLGREQLTLSAPTPVRLETRLSISVTSAPQETSLSGVVTSISREALSGSDRYSVLVRLDKLEAHGAEEHAELVRRLLVPDELRKRRGIHYDFSGQIARLPMDEVFTLLKRERYSGVLSAGIDREFFSFEVKDGEVIECETALGLAPQEAVTHVRSLTDGEFKFRGRRPPQVEALARPTARLMQEVLNLGNSA